jgi:hypothetical protein
MGLPITAECDTAWIQTRDCSDASCTEMQCFRPLHHSEGQYKRIFKEFTGLQSIYRPIEINELVLHGFHMTVQGCIHWVGLGGLTHLQPEPANQNEFVPIKRHYFMQILVSLPPSVATNSLKGCSRHHMVEFKNIYFLFHLMKHGTNTLHVVCILLFSVHFQGNKSSKTNLPWGRLTLSFLIYPE